MDIDREIERDRDIEKIERREILLSGLFYIHIQHLHCRCYTIISYVVVSQTVVQCGKRLHYVWYNRGMH